MRYILILTIVLNLFASSELEPNKFAQKIKTMVKNEDLNGLFKLVKGELENGPKRESVKNRTFKEVFSDNWKENILKGDIDKLGSKGYMIASGLIWFDLIDNHFEITAINGIKKEFDTNTTTKSWEYEEKVISPLCLSTIWMSSDNYKEFAQHFKIKNYQDFEKNPGQYFGKEINSYNSIHPSWDKSENLNLSFEFNNECMIDKENYKENKLCAKDEYSDVPLCNYYEVYGDINPNKSKEFAPNIDAKCLAIKLIKVVEESTGSFGDNIWYYMYGIYDTNTTKYIVPLKNFQTLNEMLKYTTSK